MNSNSASAGSFIPAGVSLEVAIPTSEGLSLPLAVRNAGDGSGRLFIVERSGVIKIFDGSGVLAEPFLDIGDNITTSGEGGLLGLAFHPDYASNGLFYVNYTASSSSPIPTGDTVISEFSVSGDPNEADATSERILMSIAQDFSNHNGGDLHFGADDYLYIGMGDGGSGNDPCNRGQTLDPDEMPTGGCDQIRSATLLGKMLRIDVDSTTPAAMGGNGLCGAESDGSAEYGIPNDNPFAGPDPDNACDEIWSYGLRNPFRFSFDRITGDMFIGDVGQDAWEEIDFEPFDTLGGLNYGWKVCEGSFQRGSMSNPCGLSGSILPIIEVPHPTGGSITGGYRYRGPIAALQGLYIFADFQSGDVTMAQETSPGVWESEFFQDLGGGLIAGFGEDEVGNVYIALFNNEVLVFDGPDETFFIDGFEDIM